VRLKPAPEGGLAVFGGEGEGWWNAGHSARATFTGGWPHR
jgi:hypothetical protein